MEFSSAHALRGYRGKCENTHGHNYRVEVHVRGERLNDIGLTNAQRIAEARRLLLEELAPRADGMSRGRSRRRDAGAPGASRLEASALSEAEWAKSFADRVARGLEPSDADVDRFFDAVER